MKNCCFITNENNWTNKVSINTLFYGLVIHKCNLTSLMHKYKLIRVNNIIFKCIM